jgi:outer membrane protein OmpA-like peptidoglycan-associated protein
MNDVSGGKKPGPPQITLTPGGLFVVAGLMAFLAVGIFAYVQITLKSVNRDSKAQQTATPGNGAAYFPQTTPSAPSVPAEAPQKASPTPLESGPKIAAAPPIETTTPPVLTNQATPPPLAPATPPPPTAVATPPPPTPEIQSGEPDGTPGAATELADLESTAVPLTPEAPKSEAVPAPITEQPEAESKSEAAAPPPAAVANADEERKVRDEVLHRIDLLPELTEKDRAHLTSQVERARRFWKLAIVPFGRGKTSPDGFQVDYLVENLNKPEVQQLFEDPTVVLVMVGYADKQGSPEKNLELSRTRAQSLIDTLQKRTKLENTMRAVGIGSSTLFDATNYDKNRVVEIWLVQP